MELNGEAVLRRSPEEVFAYVTDLSNDAAWRKGIDESGLRSSTSFGAGEVGYSRAGDKEVEWRITSYSPNESVNWELLDGPFLGRGGYHVIAVEDGTLFTLVSDVEPAGVYKLLGPLFGWMGRRRNQAVVEKLKKILESQV